MNQHQATIATKMRHACPPMQLVRAALRYTNALAHRFNEVPKDLFKYTTNLEVIYMNYNWLGSAPDVYSLSRVWDACPAQQPHPLQTIDHWRFLGGFDALVDVSFGCVKVLTSTLVLTNSWDS